MRSWLLKSAMVFMGLITQVHAALLCQVDSLAPGIRSMPNDSVKVRTMYEACWGCRYERPDEAISCFEEGIRLSNEIGYEGLLANLNMGIGVCHYYKQNFATALQFYYRGLAYAEKSHNAYITGACYMNIGNVHHSQGNHKLAKSLYLKALPFLEQSGHKREMNTIWNNLGMIEGQVGNYDSAEFYLLKAVEVARQEKMEYGIANTLNNLGIAYTFRKEYGKALGCINEALKLNTQYNDQRGVANSNSDLGNIYMETGNYPQAWKHYNQAVEGARKTKHLYLLAFTYEKMSELAYKTLDYKKAYEYQKLYKQITDTLFSEEKTRQITEMETKYQTDKKDQEIVSLRNENLLKESLSWRQKWIAGISMVAMIVFIVLSALLKQNIKEKKKANRILQQKNLQITRQKKEIEQQKNELENYTAELEKENILAQYETLKNQVNPHFLFNSLNILASLVKKNPDQAYQFTKEFAKIYRVVLELKEHLLIGLAEELDFVQSYIFLQKIRFGENLVVQINVPAEYLSFFVPPFSLQLLVENAIKHNIISREQPLYLEICCEEDTLVVKNNLQPRTDLIRSIGVGNRNLMQRYAIISERKPLFYTDAAHYYAKLPLVKEE